MSIADSSYKADTPASAERNAKKSALRGGIFAYFVDQFDIFLPIITLAPALIYFVPDHLDAGTKALISGFIFASTLIARPLGAAVFGHYADRIGRHRTTLVAIAGFGLATLGIVVLPGHQQVGNLSIALMIILRFVSGFFLGGEYSTAVPLAMEWTPKHKRAMASGSITCTSPAATALIAGLTVGLLSVLPAGTLDSPYVQWGWRIPFLIGAVLSAILFVYYLRHVEESPNFSGSKRDAMLSENQKSPLLALVSSKHRKDFIQIFIFMTGVWLLTDMSVATLPGTLKHVVGLSDSATSAMMMVVFIFNIGFFLICAALSQRFGRRPVYIGFGLCATIIASASYYMLCQVSAEQTLLILLLCLLINAFSIACFGPIAAYLTERFPARLRATGYGVGYSLALVLPAFYPFYIDLLSQFMPLAYAPVALTAVGGLLVLMGAVAGPETRDVDMNELTSTT